MWHTLWQTLNNGSKISWLYSTQHFFLRTQSSDRGLSAKNHFQSYRTKIDFCHSVRLCVLYIRAAAAARDRVAAVVGAWPNIWLRHHQTRYFFFSIYLSLFENQRERSLFDGQIPSTDIWYNDGRHWDSNHEVEVWLFSLLHSVKKSLQSLTQFSYTQNVAFWMFQLRHFPPIFVLLKATCLFDRKLQIFKKSPKWTILGIFC